MRDDCQAVAHASVLADVNGDGQVDLVTGTRFMGRNAVETEPLALYWYERRVRRPEQTGQRTTGAATVEWTRHVISAGGDAGGGLQIAAGDIDNDGDIDLVSGGKSGLFLLQNLSK